MISRSVCCRLLLVWCFCVNANASMQSAFQEGTQFADQKRQGIAAELNLQRAAEHLGRDVPTNAPESSLYRDGMGIIANDGLTKQNQCNNLSSSASQERKAECEAVNFAVKNPTQRPAYQINPTEDPLITESEKIQNQTANSQNPQSCRVVERKLSETFAEETCLQSRPIQSNQCTQGWEFDCTSPLDGLRFNVQPTNTYQWHTHSDSRLTIGIGGRRDYPQGHYSVTASINVDRNRLRRMQLTSFEVDDNIHVFINGQEVLYHRGWRATPVIVNRDVTHLFREGLNDIQMRVHNEPRGHTPMTGVLYFQYEYACIERWVDRCTALASNDQTQCWQTKQTCTQGAETRLINGQPVFKECWQTTVDYACRSAPQGDCDPFTQRGCEQTSSQCLESLPDGSCRLFEQKFRCQTNPARTVQQTICTDAFCSDGNCGDDTSPPDQDFAKGVVMLEAVREAGVYGTNQGNIQLFAGERKACTRKTAFGGTIMSCCRIESGGERLNNFNTQHTSATSFNGQGIHGDHQGQNNQLSGSRYTYDNAFEKNPTIDSIVGGLTGGWLSCDEDEKRLSLARGQGLCVEVSSECKERVFGVGCVERRYWHCCFKSKLAKLINRQGRQQLGLPLNQCGGFNQEQLERLDFSRMNLDEFIHSIAPPSFDIQQKNNQIRQRGSNMVNTGHYWED